jgi:transposase
VQAPACHSFSKSAEGRIWRKLSFGTQSASGSRFLETMLTMIETCRQQKRNTFTFVADAVRAHFAGGHAASLLAGV